jgi:hypothetical protein
MLAMLLRCLNRTVVQQKSWFNLNGAQAGRIKACGSTMMNDQPWRIGILALGVILSLAGCGKEQSAGAASTNAPAGKVDKLKEQARNTVTTTKDYLAQQKERWQKTYSDKLSKFDKQLADLKAKSSAAGDKARSDWNKALTQLEQKKTSVARKFEQLKDASADRWHEVKTNAETAFADLEKSFKDTISRFTNDDQAAKP